jgi:hypothetical protein
LRLDPSISIHIRYFKLTHYQKLLLIWSMGVDGANAHGPDSKSLFASFSSEKEVLPA